MKGTIVGRSIGMGAQASQEPRHATPRHGTVRDSSGAVISQFDSDAPQVQIISPNWGLSTYHAFTAKSERRFANGLGWIATYTWSKWIDNLIFTGVDDATLGDYDQIQNIYDLRNERSLSRNHVPRRSVLAPVFELPVGKGKRWLEHGGPVNWVLGGWQLSGIVTPQSGSPFGVTVVNGPRDILGDNSDGKTLRPDIVGSLDLPSGQKGTPAVGQRGIQWFNTAAFAVPARNPGSDLGGGGFEIASAGSSHREMQFAIKFYY